MGENGAIEGGVAMIRDGGFCYVIGYLQKHRLAFIEEVLESQ
ncbi:MAG: hypothetical protein ACRDPC_17875 [Solirubrobacteraceae bacterium]